MTAGPEQLSIHSGSKFAAFSSATLRSMSRAMKSMKAAGPSTSPGVGGFRCADVVLVGERAQRLPAPPKDVASCTVA